MTDNHRPHRHTGRTHNSHRKVDLMPRTTLRFVPVALTVLALIGGAATGASAQSNISGQLYDVSTSTNSVAGAIGNNATAAIGSIAMDNSTFSGRAISTATSVNSAALAIGND